jgi:hypothetical protein
LAAPRPNESEILGLNNRDPTSPQTDSGAHGYGDPLSLGIRKRKLERMLSSSKFLPHFYLSKLEDFIVFTFYFLVILEFELGLVLGKHSTA